MTESRLHFNRLGVKLTLHALLSVCAALAVFFIARAGANHIIDRISMDPDLESRQNERAAAVVQRYVTSNALSSTDVAELQNVPGAETSFLIMLYSDGELVDENGSVQYQLTAEEMNRLYPISFADGEALVYIWNYGYYTYYYRIADAVCGALAFFTFVTLFVCLVRRRLRYILLLERELSVLEGGDLEYKITVQGNDELASLAKGIDDMRRSFIERRDGEAEAIRANQALVTAMSHDLRTPLTSLLGYIELIQNGQYSSNEQLLHFISASRDKVYRIKEMTDTLFEYALCSGSELPAELRSMDAYELFSQLLTEHSFELESAGFQTELRLSAFRADVQADPARLARVFENITSNVKKYADSGAPVQMELSLEHVWVRIAVKNAINAQNAVESNRIGLKTCEKIIQQHKGRFLAFGEGGVFTVVTELPVWDENNS